MAKKNLPKAGPGDAEKLRRHVRILVDLGRLASQRLSADRFLDRVVVEVARALEIDHVKVLLYRRATSDFIVAAGFGWKEGVVRSSTLAADIRSPAGRAFQTGEATTITDLAAAKDYVAPTMLKQHGIVSLANVPVFIDGATWGVLEADSAVRREFSPDTIEFLMAVSALIGAVLHRQSAEQNEAEARSAAATAEAQYQEVLLRELQHRVKNNFQVILASIAIQKRRFENEDARRALSHIESRINAISLAHDQLTPRHGQTIGLAAYVRALCASIEQQADGIAVDLDADEVELAIDRAVPLGLILNEAATNSIKHAFGHDGGRITITLKGGVGYGEARMTVADNGRGIKPDSPPGTGLNLIESLARQIGAVVEQTSSDKGALLRVTFPVIV